ncbi:MAG: VanW family protein [Armatimonadetes bacterium]|nr:VanW family protein [Armatimonadota bacterium]
MHRLEMSAAAVVIAAGLLFGIDRALAPGPGRLAQGLSIGGLPVGGLAVDEARARVAELARRAAVTPLYLYSSRHRAHTRLQELGGVVDVGGAIAAAERATRKRSVGWFPSLRARWWPHPEQEIELPVHLRADQARRRLADLAAAVRVPPVNARLRLADGRLRPTPDRPGRELDADALVQRITHALRQPPGRDGLVASLEQTPDFHAWARTARPLLLNAPLRKVPAATTVADLAGIDTILATYSTSAGGSSRNRLHNLRLACQAINGALLRPGDIFSYNETVGPRNRAAGFRTAPVIIDGQLVPGTGGGVCQVSTTVYNAGLLADLQVVRRSHHTFPIHYAPAGRDATVAHGSLDLKLRNRLEHPIVLAATLDGARVTVRVYGHHADRRAVTLVRSGRRPIVWTRVVRQGDRIVRREVVSRDVYRLSRPVRPATPRRRQEGRPDAPAAPERPTPSPATVQAVAEHPASSVAR